MDAPRALTAGALLALSLRERPLSLWRKAPLASVERLTLIGICSGAAAGRVATRGARSGGAQGGARQNGVRDGSHGHSQCLWQWQGEGSRPRLPRRGRG